MRDVGMILLRLGLPWFIVLTVGVLVVVARSGDELRYPDEHDYHDSARRLIEGKGYVDQDLNPTAFRPPGYPFMLSLVYSICNRPLAAKIVNSVCFVLSVVTLYMAMRRHNALTAWLVPLVSMCYPMFYYLSSTLYPQTLAMLGLALLAYLLGNDHSLSVVGVAVSGLLLGIVALTVPSFLLLTPILAGYVLIARNGRIRVRFSRLLLFVAMAALVIVPWSLRNYRQLGAPVLISTNSGLNLLLGNSPASRPNSGVNVDISTYLAESDGLGEAEKDAGLRRAALKWIEENPGKAAELYIQKVVNYFNYRNELFTRAESNCWRDWIVACSYYPLLALALLRIWFRRRYPLNRMECLLYVLYFSNALLSAVFFTRIRFRLPFDLLLVGIVSSFVGRVLADGQHFPRVSAVFAKWGLA